jgi:hypothetical protein
MTILVSLIFIFFCSYTFDYVTLELSIDFIMHWIHLPQWSTGGHRLHLHQVGQRTRMKAAKNKNEGR